MEKPREKTTEEIREEFLTHIWHTIEFWDKMTDEKDTRRKLEGLAFSILSTLDGSSADLPGFLVAPYPHETDKDYCIEHGENYYPYNDQSQINGDIAGSLHESFYGVGKKLNLK